MKYNCLCVALLLITNILFASGSDSTTNFTLADSVKAVQYFAAIDVQHVPTKKEGYAGIGTSLVKISLETEKGRTKVVFEFPRTATVMATGFNVKNEEKGELEWEYRWTTRQSYKLLLSTAYDSAANFLLYSGYIWLPEESKWKMIGTCRINGQWGTLQNPYVFSSSGRKNRMTTVINEAWVQRNNGSWKNLKGISRNSPIVNLFSHVDSTLEYQKEVKLIEEAIANGTEDARQNIDGVYYKIIKEGTGRQVMVSDTVSVLYKLTLWKDTAIIDQSMEKPAKFPLKRLIRGWQIAVPLLKVGGRIKLVIPSTHAYSIRTRAAKIPPNSILKFEIEVVNTKPAE